LVNGKGPLNLSGEPETMYGLLFPFLIAGTATVVPSAETAAHVVALAFGTALIAIVFQIAHVMYGRRSGYICALLVAGHPLLVKMSGSVLNENVYMTLLMAAIYFGLRALELKAVKYSVLCGLCFGLAYLARPEAAAYPFLLALALCIAGFAHKRWKQAVLAAAIVVGGFGVVASPYVAYLYKETGSLRFEGKWNINYSNARRIMLGMNIEQAAFGLDSDLTEGPLLEPIKSANYTPYPHSLSDKIDTLVANAKRNVWTVYDQFTDDVIGSPALLVLVVIGLFRRPWSNRRLTQESVLLAVAMSVVFLLLTATETAVRYFLPLLPVLLIWAGNGLEELGEWARTSEALAGNLSPQTIVVTMGVQIFAVIAIFGLSALGTRSVWEIRIQSDPSSVAARDAGRWLRDYRNGPKRVAGWISIVPYYANATMVALPYADSELMLGYLESKDPDFVVLESQRAKRPPAIDDWMARGIPSDRAHVIYDATNPRGDRIVICSWAEKQ
jgi:4-amino-4-deoxy-L-arabinose transferase-like glycosyltransferase